MDRHSARSTFASGALALLAALTVVGRPASGQSLLDRSPNITGGWVGPAGTLHFNFLHRFTAGEAPTRKVNSSPTFLVGAGLPRKAFVGLNYATNSDVAPRYPNEWEFFGRVAPLRQEGGWLADIALQGGYNLAARSVDGELTLGRSAGPVTVLAAARFLSDAFGLGESRAAVAGGAVLRFGSYIAMAGDYAYMPDRPAGFDDAWSAALQLAIPYTPHTFSLQAANTNTATLQGASASRGGLRRYGFEFTIPVTLSRYIRRGSPAAAVTGPTGGDTVRARQAAPVVRAEIRSLKYLPARLDLTAGTIVEWTNNDPLAHTVTADDGSWDSGPIEPGKTFRRRFATAGTFAFHCTPHPFMKGVVVVR